MYLWPQCKYGTIYTNKLKRHALSDKEVPNFECDFQNCNKVFKRNDCLKAHKLIDSSETKFTCDWNQCLRKFNRNCDLTNHQNIVHLRIKKFECNYSGCHQRFTDKNYLKIH